MNKYKPQNKDYIAFASLAGAKTYGAAGDFNIFMMCETLNKSALRDLPSGYSFRLCRR